jgi:putative flippase GtrA
LKKFLKFALGGTPGALLGYLILYLIPENLSTLSLVLFYSIAFLVKESVSFTIHKWWTFDKKNTKKVENEIWSYILVTLYLLTLNTIVYLFFFQLLGINKVLSQVLVNSLFSIINFFETKNVFDKTRST